MELVYRENFLTSLIHPGLLTISLYRSFAFALQLDLFQLINCKRYKLNSLTKWINVPNTYRPNYTTYIVQVVTYISRLYKLQTVVTVSSVQSAFLSLSLLQLLLTQCTVHRVRLRSPHVKHTWHIIWLLIMSPRYSQQVRRTSNLYPSTCHCIRRHICIRIQVARPGYMYRATWHLV